MAPVVGLCEDESVNGAPFYVMEFVEGPILRGLAEAEIFPDEDDRRAIGERVADTLVQIHAVDPDAVGLGDLGRKEDYVARQLRRWQGQWEKSKTRELEPIDRVHDGALGAHPRAGPGDDRPRRLPPRQHDPQPERRGRRGGRLGALHPRRPARRRRPADGLLARARRGRRLVALGMPANLAPGFPTQAEIAARYAERSGRDLSDLDFYVALGYWKLAIILEGVYARYVAGGYGKVDEGIHAFARLVERLAEEAERVERRRPLSAVVGIDPLDRRVDEHPTRSEKVQPRSAELCLRVVRGLLPSFQQGDLFVKQIRKRLTYANVMSSIAVFLVLGGATAFAAGSPRTASAPSS